LAVLIGSELDAIREEVAARKVTTREEADAKFDIIMAANCWSGEERAAIVARLAKESADHDWQLVSQAQWDEIHEGNVAAHQKGGAK
jgi:hypothetical protein